MTIITITFTDADVKELAKEYGVDEATAMERAQSWAGAITDTATTLISVQLASVIQHDTP
jgi:hypothetical protein